MDPPSLERETSTPSLDLSLDRLTDGQLVSLHQVMREIACQDDTRQILHLIADRACALTSASNAAIMLLDPQRQRLDFVAAAGIDARQIQGVRVRVEDALAGHTALSGEVFVGENLTSAALASIGDPRTAIGVQSAAIVPVFLGGVSSGAVAVTNNTIGDSFDGTDVLLLQILGNAAAVAIARESLLRDSELRERERDILFATAHASSSSLNVQEVLSRVLASLAERMDADVSAVYLLDDEETRLYLASESGMIDDDQDRQLAADSGFGHLVLQSQEPVLIHDVATNAWPSDIPLTTVRSLIAVPVRARTAPNGVIVVGSRHPSAYTERDAGLLQAVASQTALALENAWLYEEATRRSQETAAIYEVSQTIGATLDLDRVLNFVAESVLSLLQVDRFALFLANPLTGRLEIKIARNVSDEAVRTMQPAVGEGIAGWVAEFETPTAVQDVAADHRNRSCPIHQEDVTSLVSVPLQTGERVIGVMHGMSSRRRLFTVRELELLYTIGNQVASAIVNAQLYDQARRDKDELRKSVRRVARALGSSTDPGVAAQVIADMAQSFMQSDRSLVYAVEADDYVVLRGASQFRAAQAAIDRPLGKLSPAAWVARHGRSLQIPDIASDARFALPDFATADRVGGYLGVPLKLADEIVGVLEVYARTARQYTYGEVRSLLTFAAQASVGLKNAVLVARAKRRIEDLDALGEIGRLLGSEMEPRLVRAECLALLCRATGSDCGVLEVFDRPEDREFYHSREAAEQDVVDERQKIDSALIRLSEWVRSYNETAVISGDPGNEAIVALAVPLRRGRQESPIGAVVVSRVSPAGPYDSYDRRLLETAGNFIAARTV